MTTVGKKPVIPVTELEQLAFCQAEGTLLRPRTLEEEFRVGVRWQSVPARYLRLTPEEIERGILDAREALGAKVVVLGHHYQRPDVIKYADYRGDSYKLSEEAAAESRAEYVVFCGVHFMAETADILTPPDRTVILPNMAAGCSMADMATAEDAEECWEALSSVLGDGEVTPVTYMNSAATIKALCGRNGGIVCTSSNARGALRWAFERGERVLFLPDQHLGRNTALKLGVGLDEMVVWNPFERLGGHTPDALRRARMILWQGHCSVHTRFTADQIRRARAADPDINIIVHPECLLEVVEAADCAGSTEFIAKTIGQAPSGTAWGVGTEVNLVQRLAVENPDKTVFCLDPVVCPCSTMYRVHPGYLLWVLEGLLAGMTINQVSVPEDVAGDARLALERMLEVPE